MIHVLRVLEAASEVQAFCNEQKWRFCFIGGVAVQRWGEPRMTQDADLTLLTGFGEEERYIDTLLKAFRGRRGDARDFALNNRVLLIETNEGIAIDVALGAVPFEERSIERASPWEWADKRFLVTCSAEDLIVHKAFAARDLDWGDIERVLIRQHGKIDLGQVGLELRPLLEIKGESGALQRLEQKIALVERRLRAKP